MKAFAWSIAPVLILSSLSAAADPPSAAAQARRAFQSAVPMMEEERWEAAASALEASIQLHPTQVALYDLAVCLRELHRVPEAIARLDELLTRFGARVDTARRDEVTRMRAQLASTPASLRVAVNQPDAEIFVDGQRVARGSMAEAFSVPAGDHEVSARLGGGATARRHVDVHPGEAVNVVLELATLPAAPEPAPVAPPARVPPVVPTPDRRGPAPVWSWTLAGLAAAGAVATAVLGGLTLAASADYDSDPRRTRDDQEAGRQLALATDVALGVTVVAAGLATVLFLGPSIGQDDPEAATAAVRIGPGHVVVRGVF